MGRFQPVLQINNIKTVEIHKFVFLMSNRMIIWKDVKLAFDMVGTRRMWKKENEN